MEAVDPVSLFSFGVGVVFALLFAQAFTQSQMKKQEEIAKRGQTTMGKIVGVWRPPLAGSFPRLYVEFEPLGASRVVRACHIDRRSLDGVNASLPAVGTYVNVRYLPDRPTEAVIAKLVSRFHR
jgi:hypothetical protein